MSKEAKKPFRQSMAEWRQFVYNPNSGEFLGRTAKSWGKGCRGRGRGASRHGPPAETRGGGGRGRARGGGGQRDSPPR